jgi:hypothetical protein
MTPSMHPANGRKHGIVKVIEGMVQGAFPSFFRRVGDGEQGREGDR